MSYQRHSIKRQKKAIKTINSSVQAKLDVERKAMGDAQWNADQQLKTFISNRPMGNY